MSELVNHEVDDDDCLEDEQGLNFLTLVIAPIAIASKFAIRAHTNDHVDGHQGGLEADPALLEAVRD